MSEQGYFSHFNQKKHFGFIIVKRPGGWLEHYFALDLNIIRKEVEPGPDVPCVFDGIAPPRHSGEYMLALNIQVLAPTTAAAEEGGEGRVS